MATLQQTSELFQKFKVAFSKNDPASASSTLSQLKLCLIQLPSLPPTFAKTATAQQELLLARDILEHAVLLSLKKQDEAGMERSFAQLRNFYSDTRTLMPHSDQENSMIGLDLLRLLVQNRIAEFHTELELISPEVQESPFIKHAIQLEQWLMVGAYNKVLGAAQTLPSEFHQFFMQQLASTVRDEIASCSEKAYEKLNITEARKMMMFESDAAVQEYAFEHGWKITNGVITFQNEGSAAPADSTPSLSLINNSLVYAKELERIV